MKDEILAWIGIVIFILFVISQVIAWRQPPEKSPYDYED